MRHAASEHGIAVLGGGPAGLTAGLVLAHRGIEGHVFEADAQVGGIAKTVERGGFRFDLGGHRFFTKLGPVQRLWEQTLGDEFLVRPRLSRIFYRGEYFAYPLRAEDVVRRLGAIETLRCAGSYLAARLRRGEPPRHVRGLGDRTLRPPALQRVLPRVHREGLGDPGQARSSPSGRPSGSATSRSGPP